MYTPGPWVIKPVGKQLYIEGGPNGSGGFVCDMQLSEAETVDHPTIQADARLIAAAPELLKALKALLQHEREREPNGIGIMLDSVALEQAKQWGRAAIAKAEGRV